ncbi:MAG: VWA domain-containing protein [Acidobacteriia bacterium]|nr:VWA domain-containing protein [Terriglobia bacterium]
MTPVDFEAKFRGQPVHILSVAPDNRPRRIVILLDVSGSMHGGRSGREWELARAMAAHIALSRLPNSEMALILFSDKIIEQVDFSQGTKLVTERLNQIGAQRDYTKKNVRGTTALLDSILAGFRMLDAPTSADVLYAITDGGDNKSHSKVRNVERTLVSAGVRFYASLFSSEFGPGVQALGTTSPEDIADIAKATGGEVLGMVGVTPAGDVDYQLTDERKRAFSDALQRMYLAMLLNYRVEVEFPQPVKKWSDWTLRLSSEKRRQFKDAQVGFPSRLAPCVAPASNN